MLGDEPWHHIQKTSTLQIPVKNSSKKQTHKVKHVSMTYYGFSMQVHYTDQKKQRTILAKVEALWTLDQKPRLLDGTTFSQTLFYLILSILRLPWLVRIYMAPHMSLEYYSGRVYEF